MIKTDIGAYFENVFSNAVVDELGRPIERVLASADCRLLTPLEFKEGS